MLILLTVYHAEPETLHRNSVDDAQFVTVQDLDGTDEAPNGADHRPSEGSAAAAAAGANRAAAQPNTGATGASGAPSASAGDDAAAADAHADAPAPGPDLSPEDYPYAASAVLLRHYVERGRPPSPQAARAGKRPAPRESPPSTEAEGEAGGEEGRAPAARPAAQAPSAIPASSLDAPRHGEAYDEVLRREHALPAPPPSFWPRVHHVVGWFRGPHGSEIVPAVELGLLVQLTDELVAHYRDYEVNQTAKRRRESELADGPHKGSAPPRTRRRRTLRFSEDVIAAAAADMASQSRPGAGPISMSKRLYEVFTILDAIGMASKMELARAAPAAPAKQGAHSLPSALTEPVRSPGDLFPDATTEGEGTVYLPEPAAATLGESGSKEHSSAPASAEQSTDGVPQDGASRTHTHTPAAAVHLIAPCAESRGYNPQRRKRMYAALNRLLLVPEPLRQPVRGASPPRLFPFPRSLLTRPNGAAGLPFSLCEGRRKGRGRGGSGGPPA